MSSYYRELNPEFYSSYTRTHVQRDQYVLATATLNLYCEGRQVIKLSYYFPNNSGISALLKRN